VIDDEDEDEDEDVDEGNADVDQGSDADINEDSSDDGFRTDDEEGFAGSDDDSDAGSEYNWWAPGRSTTATSIDLLDHIRPMAARTMSQSSIDSTASAEVLARSNGKLRRGRSLTKQKPVNIHPKSPELPDSTDFVCGTLDEDRPLEEAYKAELDRRRAAKHKMTPQDIDPTFPASDPEMDEEDEDSDFSPAVDESDHPMFLHGKLESHDEGTDTRDRPSRKRSPLHSPKRLRSPPPPARRGTVHRSPPPRRLFGQSPKRLRSPPPAGRLRSPPPTRRSSVNRFSTQDGTLIPQGVLAERPNLAFASSLPRATHAVGPFCLRASISEETEHSGAEGTPLPTRGAIDIVKGLEKKRQRRREMLYQKHCRRAVKEKEKQKRPQPGKGAERMKEMGLCLAAYRGTRPANPQNVHILSY